MESSPRDWILVSDSWVDSFDRARRPNRRVHLWAQQGSATKIWVCMPWCMRFSSRMVLRRYYGSKIYWIFCGARFGCKGGRSSTEPPQTHKQLVVRKRFGRRVRLWSRWLTLRYMHDRNVRSDVMSRRVWLRSLNTEVSCCLMAFVGNGASGNISFWDCFYI